MNYQQFKNDKRLQIKIRTCDMLLERTQEYYRRSEEETDFYKQLQLTKHYLYWKRVYHLYLLIKNEYIKQLESSGR